MTQKRPINADAPAAVPNAEEKAEATTAPEAAPAPAAHRRGISAVPLAIAGLALLASVFLVVAIVAGGGSDSGSSQGGGPVAGRGSEDESEGSSAGYAGNNTTRIGGDDPATLAAAVALTVFPSRTPAQRPASVALVGEESWQNVVAAAVMMAPPIRAPLLIAAASGLPEPTARAVTAMNPTGNKLKPAGNRSREGPQAYVFGPIATPTLRSARTGETTGAVQAAEIEAIRNGVFRGPPKHVIVASETEPAFAAPAAAWAARSGDTVLYAHRNKLPAPTRDLLERFPNVPVYVLGPPSVISTAVLDEISKLVKRVKRVGGPTPAENAIALARYSDGSFGWNVNDPGHGFVIARSSEPLSAALAAPLSASGTWGPMLLTESADKLPKSVREYLLDVKPGYTTDPTRAFYNHVWVIGETEAIDVNQQAEIDQLAELAKVKGEG